MDVLKVKNLCKSYPGFALNNVSFAVKKGTIMGFIGRNGAGKTTTLKSILNMVHTENGEISFFDLDIKGNEKTIKQRTGYAGGAVDYYKKKRISHIINTTKRFYKNWDDGVCEHYLTLFSIDKNKTPSQLSQGMQVKLNLAVALSHRAELLILDEPTSGLDPVSREELLEIFRYLKAQGVTILFSTHITSDLDKVADDITYIREGSIVYTGDIREFAKGENLEDVMVKYEKEHFREKFAL